MRFALGLEYDGSAYAGWQHQGHSHAVQQVVQEALTTVAAEPIAVRAAGRTDTGVHATLQVVHFDTSAVRSERGWLLGSNSNLPRDVSALWVKSVDDSFDARRSARARSYRYVIANRPQRSALAERRAAWIHAPLDGETMHHAAQSLVGDHDFSAFRASSCEAPSPRRRLDRIAVTRHGDLLTIDLTANAFLHHMVRNIAGTLIAVGKGEHPANWVAEVLASCDRRAAGVTAPAGGLYLVDVEYPPAYGLPRGRLPDLLI